jgi:hypothetical protein
MQKLEGEVFTYARVERNDLTLREGTTEASFGFGRIIKTAHFYEGPTWATVPEIRAARPFPVHSYRELVQIVAHLASGNRRHTLLFRGQTEDHRDQNGRSVLYPTLFRPERGQAALRSPRLKRRVRELFFARKRVMESRDALELRARLHNHPESPIALLQHYEICPTPYLDLTQSLRVASSVALLAGDGKAKKGGFVFVVAIPHPQASISHFVDHEMVLIKLLSVCPYRALRPHFQEGYLLGRYPWNASKDPGDNAAHRLIAKLYLDNAKGRFWSRGFSPIPAEALLPRDDPFGAMLKSLFPVGWQRDVTGEG